MITRDSGSAYWDTVAGKDFDIVWRSHADAVNARLLKRWLAGALPQPVLKTDAFDEAMGEGPWGAFGMKPKAVCMDVSMETLKAASGRHPEFLMLGADVRSLPLKSDSVGCVISLSTLDHFGSEIEIRQSLKEIFRVLRPGGTLLLTLDNPGNPVVGLRNRLPKGALYSTGVVPYRVGATLGAKALGRELRALGFEILETGHIMHCPRVAAVPLSGLVGRMPWRLRKLWWAALMGWEFLGNLPTAGLTGHFAAALARKPGAAA